MAADGKRRDWLLLGPFLETCPRARARALVVGSLPVCTVQAAEHAAYILIAVIHRVGWLVGLVGRSVGLDLRAAFMAMLMGNGKRPLATRRNHLVTRRPLSRVYSSFAQREWREWRDYPFADYM